MSASLHLFDPQRSIRFIKGSDLADLQSTPNETQLDGGEIKRFYDDLISRPSTSKADVKVEVKEIKKEEPDKKPFVKASEIELTERDERLFLKAAELDDLETLYKYLQAGMDVNLKDPFGWNALMVAAAGGASQSIQLLLHCDADFEYAVNGMNAEQLAKKNKHKAIARFIADFRTKQSEQQAVTVHDLPEERYCEVCQKNHSDSNHETSIPHLVNLGERPAEGWAYKIPFNNIGYRLLKLKSWNEGQGLGKLGKEGRKYPIRTTLKRDTKGLGLEKKAPMKVTHFESMDPQAIRLPKKNPRRTYIRQLDKELTKKKEKQIELRRSLM